MSDVILTRDEQYWLQVQKDLFAPRGDGKKVGLTTRLHTGQIEVLKPLYEEGIKNLFLPCARKFGKSELAGFVLWYHALYNPGSACYYIAPEAQHGKKIMWDTNRIQKFMGKDTAKYVSSINGQTLMVKLKNGSFIQVMGSDNWAAANGLTPDIAIYDEYKVFNPLWHTEFNPNRAAKACPLIVIGTLPKVGDKNIDNYEAMLEYAKTDKNSRVFFKTIWDNPINHLAGQKEMIEEQIATLRARGDEDVVQREYYSKVVPGGSNAVFPMLDEKKHLVPNHEIIKEISRDLNKLEFYIVADPGTTTCFAVLFAALNPYTKKLYILDEIYEKSQQKTVVSNIYKEIYERSQLINPHIDLAEDWYKVFDEAAAWFATEMSTRYNLPFLPTDKRHGDKEEGLNIIKDQLLYEVVVISDKCKFLFKEMQSYAKDGRGKIPKKNDHLIDCYRYLVQACHYDFNTLLEAIKKDDDPIRKGRHRGLLDDLRNEVGDDWTSTFSDSFDWD